MTVARPDYWNMNDANLAEAWRTIDAMNRLTDCDGTITEHVAFVEDAILQRIGAPDSASGDDREWQDRIRTFGQKVAA